ncbi:MAG: serine/threonine-protein kinase [Kiritimatiellae bacterium]|nr:serine/threonine-protein kinase [Kiritimatiellia bacterium]
MPGRVGGFLLYQRIGEGEMGTVYRATDESLKRDVAIKLVRGCHVDDPESCEQLRNEACAAGKLNHPRVAQVHALNFSNGFPFLVMELVTGEDFAQRLAREGHIDERAALRMALDVADGLSALHREGLAHGDIKPGNIVLDRDGNAKLVDFGLSGMRRRDSRGTLLGTPFYIAPELIRGSADTHRSDLYSLGATLYHLLAGRPPSEGVTSADIFKARVSHPPVPLRKHAHHVSLLTQKLVMRMLEIDPEKRQLDSDAVAAGIREALAQLDSTPPGIPGVSGFAHRVFARLKIPLPSRRHALVSVLGLIAVAEILIAVREHSFDQTLEWLHGKFAGRPESKTLSAAQRAPEAAASVSGDAEPAKTAALPVGRPQPQTEPVAPVRKEGAPQQGAPLPVKPPSPALSVPIPELFTTRIQPKWQSVNLGEPVPHGSTIQMGETVVVQSTGTGMWNGHDCGRFVWTKVSGDYSLSAQVKMIADKNGLAITGLLVKGDDFTHGPGLLFGFLGSGELFLQTRKPDETAVIVKRTGRPLQLPVYLKIIRNGKMFQACVSSYGRNWYPFAECSLELPPGNAIGLAVCSQDPATLAMAKFADICLLTPPRAAVSAHLDEPLRRVED